MQPAEIHARLERLLAQTTGRPRWAIDADRKKALFCKRPAETEEIILPNSTPPLQSHLAAEAYFQTEALCVIALELERIADNLKGQSPE